MVLTTADIHMTDTPRESYRWGLFAWLRQMAEKHECKELVIAGDLTEAKDRHSAMLVNRFVSEIVELTKLALVYIIPGNHDFRDESTPFFQFLRKIPRVRFFSEPEVVSTLIGESAFIPNTGDFAGALERVNWKGADFLFAHQTFGGAKVANGTQLAGIPPSFFKTFKGQVWSGDIHVPQDVAPNVHYVGAPYRTDFGDLYTPRVVLLDRNSKRDLHFPCPSKEVVKWVGRKPDLQIMPAKGDLVKIEVQLKREDYPEWQAIRYEVGTFAAHQGWVVCGLELKAMAMLRNTVTNQTQRADPEALVRSFVKTQRAASGLADLGCELLKEVSGG